MTDGADPGTSVKPDCAGVVRGGALEEDGGADVAAADCGGCETVDEGAALASLLAPPVAAAKVGAATLTEASCLSHSRFLPLTAATHKE